MRGTRQEFSTIGFDPALQLYGTGVDKSGANVGLVIPAHATGKVAGRITEPFVFMLANRRIAPNQKTRLVGARQLVTIASLVNQELLVNYTLEKVVTSPTFHFPDGSVSWHIQLITAAPPEPNSVDNRASSMKGYSRAPALVFNSIVYNDAGFAYTAPQIYGVPLLPALSNFHDLRFPWDSSQSWDSLDIEIAGPCDIAFYAVVRQTNPETRTTLTLPGSLPGGTSCIPEEDAFVVNFPNTVYHRVAGSLIFQDPDMNQEL